MQKKTINFQPMRLNDEQLSTPISRIMPENTDLVLAKRPSGNYEVVTREDADHREISEFEDYIINQTDMVKAGSKVKYLEADMSLLYHNFLKDHEKRDPKVEFYGEDVEEDVDYVCIRNFPLPKSYQDQDGDKEKYKPKKEDIVIVLTEYPERGPHGIHIRGDSPNRDKIEEALGGHVYDSAFDHPEDTEDLESQGWEWLCFHYKDAQWDFNLRDISRGDCLAKYLINLYAALSGVFPDDD